MALNHSREMKKGKLSYKLLKNNMDIISISLHISISNIIPVERFYLFFGGLQHCVTVVGK